MERPERPSRHKSNPSVKYPIRPTFSSDSESDLNDSDAPPIQITYYQQHPPESSNANTGPSTSSSGQGNQGNSESSSNNMMRVSPMPLRVTLSPISTMSTREEDQRTEQLLHESVRRKRSSAAASVLLDSINSLIGSNSSNGGITSPERPLERFQHSDYVIRPRSFCNLDCGNPLRPHVYKLKRPNAPLDLTPSTSNRDSSCQAPVVTSSFSLRENSNIPSTSENSQNNYIMRSNVPPYVIPPRSEQQSTNSSILRQFDEMCTPVRRRARSYSVRFFDSPRFSEDLHHNESTNNTPLNIRSPERAGTSSGQQHSSTADIINRHLSSTPDLIANDPSIINDSPYMDHNETNRNSIDDGVAMELEQSNDDVIVVGTPERPPLPGSPDPYMVPSSRSPSPAPPIPTTRNRRNKSQTSRGEDVPMTLQELNQTIVSLLECPVCLDHATPPIYQCCKGHILCQNCHPRLTTCPICRSRLPGDRNSTMEKVAEKLMYPCKNTITGCNMMLKLDDKQEHEEGCGFRHYACIVAACHWKGYKPELVVHLQSNHPDKLLSGSTKEVLVPLSVPAVGTMFLAHHWIQSAHNEVFSVIFHIDLYKRIMKGCVIYIGSPDKADKFSYLFELKQQVPPYRKLTYSRSTHVDTLKPGQPLCLSNDFSMNIDMARLYRPEDCLTHAIPVHVSILQVE